MIYRDACKHTERRVYPALHNHYHVAYECVDCAVRWAEKRPRSPYPWGWVALVWLLIFAGCLFVPHHDGTFEKPCFLCNGTEYVSCANGCDLFSEDEYCGQDGCGCDKPGAMYCLCNPNLTREESGKLYEKHHDYFVVLSRIGKGQQ